MQSSQSAADIYKTIVGNVSTIMTNKDMNAAAKQAAVDQQMKMLKDGMAVSSAVGQLNLGATLNFSDSVAAAGNPTPAAPPKAPVASDGMTDYQRKALYGNINGVAGGQGG
jgi:hypothetical protein